MCLLSSCYFIMGGKKATTPERYAYQRRRLARSFSKSFDTQWMRRFSKSLDTLQIWAEAAWHQYSHDHNRQGGKKRAQQSLRKAQQLDQRVDAVMQQVFSMETENISVLEAVDGDTE